MSAPHPVLSLARQGAVELGEARRLGLSGGSFTIEAWVQVADWGDDPFVTVLGGDETRPGMALRLGFKERRLWFELGASVAWGQTTCSSGIWYHLAWVFDLGEQRQRLFVNGVLDGAAAGGAPWVGRGGLFLGRFQGTDDFHGHVAELRVRRRALTAPEILAGFDRRLPEDSDALVAYWPADAVVDGTLVDARAAKSVQLHGEAAVEAVPSPPDFGEDQALFLSGRGSRLRAEVPSSGAFCLEVWLRPERPSCGVLQLEGGDGGGPPVAEAYLEEGRLNVRTVGGGMLHLDGVDWTDGNWHHLAWVEEGADGGSCRVFVDGVEGGSTAGGAGASITALVLGRAMVDPEKDFVGAAAELRLWDRARSVDEIRRDAQLRLGGHEPGLVGLWPLAQVDVGVSRNLADAPPRAGRLVGDASWVEVEEGPFDSGWVLDLNGRDGAGFEVEAFEGLGALPGTEEHELTLDFWWRCLSPEPESSEPESSGGLGSVLSYGLPGEEPVLVLSERTERPVVIHGDAGSSETLEGDAGDAVDPADGAWHRLSLSWKSATGDAVVYHDGRVAHRVTLARGRSLPGGGCLRLGPGPNPWRKDGKASGGVVCQITELRIWSRALTQEELLEYGGGPLAGYEPALAAYWPLHQSTGLTVVDHAAKAALRAARRRDAVHSGGVQTRPLGTQGPFMGRWALGLGAEGGRIRIGDIRPLTSYTVEAWVFLQWDVEMASALSPEPASVPWLTFGAAPQPPRMQWTVTRQPKGLALHVDENGAEGERALLGGALLADGAAAWHHVAVSYDASTREFRLFVDGRAVASGVGVGASLPEQPLYALRLGGVGAEGTPLRSQVLELRLWYLSRTAEEIAASMHVRCRGDEAGLVFCLPTAGVHGGQRRGVEERLLGAGDFDVSTVDARPLTTAVPPVAAALRLGGEGGGWAEVAHSAGLSLRRNEDFTLELWARWNRPGGGTGLQGESLCPLIEKVSGEGLDYALRLIQDTSEGVTVEGLQATADGTAVVSAPNRALGAGDFHHLAWVRRGGRLQLYVDGLPMAEGDERLDFGTRGGVGSTAGALRLGDAHAASTGCSVADLRLWNHARSAAGLRRQRRRVLSGTEPGLLGYWRLDDAPVDGALADHLQPLTATVHGTVETSTLTSELPLVSEGASLSTLCLRTDAMGRVPGEVLDHGLGPFTVEAWLRSTGNPHRLEDHPVMSRGGTDSGWRLLASDSGCGFEVRIGGAWVKLAMDDPQRYPRGDRWRHVAGIWNGGRLRLLVNGIPVASAEPSGSDLQVSSEGDLVIGGAPGTRRCFRGHLAELRLWKVARTPREIQRDLFERLRGDEVGLLACWPLDEGAEARTLRDVGPRTANVEVRSGLEAGHTQPLQLRAASDRQRSVWEQMRDLAWLEEQRSLEHAALEKLTRDVQEERHVMTAQARDLRHEAGRLRERLKAVETDLAALKARYSDESAVVSERYDQREAPTDLSTVRANVMRQADAARSALAAQGSRLDVTAMRLSVQHVALDGERVVLPTKETSVQWANLSELRLDLKPKGMPQQSLAQPLAVPDVLGSTADHGERLLETAGFRSRRLHLAIEEGPDVLRHDRRVVRQEPQPGAAAKPGEIVKMFIGRRRGAAANP